MSHYAVVLNHPCIRDKNVVDLQSYRRRREILGHGADIDRLCREADEALAEWRKEKGNELGQNNEMARATSRRLLRGIEPRGA